MTGATLHSIGRQALTVFLLALAAIAYVMVVISNTSSSTIIKPATPAGLQPGSAVHSISDHAPWPDAPSSSTDDSARISWQTPSDRTPDGAPFQGKQGDALYDAIILKAASEYTIDPAVIKAVIMAESGFDPQAVSYAGAQGLMQLMPRTARALGIDDALDPQASILGGTRNLTFFSSLCRAAV